MIIIADTSYIDAFSHAKKISGNNCSLSFYNNEFYSEKNNFDIFSTDNSGNVGFVSSLEKEQEIERALKWSKNFKTTIFWNCNNQRVKSLSDSHGIKNASVSTPAYINVFNSLSCIKKDVSEDCYKYLQNDLSAIPIPERMRRDIVSSFLHKAVVIGDSLSGKIYGYDLIGVLNISFLDLTIFFCKGHIDFYKFCSYFFDKNNNENVSILKLWSSIMCSLAACNLDTSNKKIKDIKYVSPKIIEAMSSRLTGLLNEKDRNYFCYCLLCVQKLERLEDILFSIVLIRGVIENCLTKKDSIKIIRSI